MKDRGNRTESVCLWLGWWGNGRLERYPSYQGSWFLLLGVTGDEEIIALLARSSQKSP
jgi:hypothetical protein